MGFLDDLKRQADALRDQQNSDDVGLQRRIELTDRACQTALAYFNTLADQLEVLKPVSRARYVLDRQHSFSGLAMSDFYATGGASRWAVARASTTCCCTGSSRAARRCAW